MGLKKINVFIHNLDHYSEVFLWVTVAYANHLSSPKLMKGNVLSMFTLLSFKSFKYSSQTYKHIFIVYFWNLFSEIFINRLPEIFSSNPEVF